MKKPLSLSLFFILNLFCAFSQELELNWQKSYGGSFFDYSTKMLKATDNNLVLWGRTHSYDSDVPDSTKSADVWRLEIDTSGNILHSNIYGISADDFCEDVCESYSGGNIVVGNNMDIGNINIKDIDGSRLQNWEKNYGGSKTDVPSKVIQTLDSNYLVVGLAKSDDGDVKLNYGANDIWILKLNQAGDTLWTKVIGGTSFDECYNVLALKDSSFILIGQTTSNDIVFTENKGGADMFIMSIDKNGTLLWSKTYGGTDHDYAYSLLETDNSEIMVVGRTSSDDYDIDTNKGDVDCWITKFDLDGNLLLSKTYGGSAWDEFRYIERYSDKYFIIGGETYSDDGDVVNNHGGADQWILIIDHNGNVVWSKCFGGTGYDDISSLLKLENKVYAFGKSTSNDGDIPINKGFFDYCLYSFSIPPMLRIQMVPEAICTGDSITFIAKNFSQYDSSLHFKWMKDDEILSGENDSILILQNFNSLDIGVYKCVAEDSSSSDTSNSIIAEFSYHKKYDTISICKGDTIMINGRFVFEPNTYFDTIHNINSCDSVYITHVKLNRTDSIYYLVTACDSYRWIDGNTYTSNTDSATYTLINTIGCDSVIVLNLTIEKTTYSSISDTVCESYISPSGKVWTTSDIYTDTIQNSMGCDSIITIDLTIDCSNSILRSEILQVSVYPNPTTGKIFIELDDLNSEILLEVYALSGELVLTEKYYNVRQIATNIKGTEKYYFIRLTNSKGEKSTFKILRY